MKKFVFILMLLSITSYSQTWEIYSDSIYSNILKVKNDKAKEFLVLAEEELLISSFAKDTTYADFLYRKGLVLYFGQKSALTEFQESLEIWESSGFFNPTKMMKIHSFIADIYYYERNYIQAYKNYKKCYQINKTSKIPENNNYFNSLYLLAIIDYYFNDDFEKAKKYASEYINLTNNRAFEIFDFKLVNAFMFTQDYIGQEKVLNQFLKNYNNKNLNNPQILCEIYYELSYLYYNQDKNIESIDYAEKALACNNNYNLNVDFLDAIYLNLIGAYDEIGDNIKAKEYQDIYFELYPDEVDYYEQLQNIIALEDYNLFNKKFIEYESILISRKEYNELLNIYSLSLTLFERSILFQKEDIENQIKNIELNRDLLTDEYLILFDILLAEFNFMSENFLQALNYSNKVLGSGIDNINIKLIALHYKALSEHLTGFNGSKTAYEALDLAIKQYGKNSPQILKYLNNILIIDIYGADNKTTEIGIQALKIIYDNGMENTEIASQIWSGLAQENFQKSNYIDAVKYYQNALEIQQEKIEATNPIILYTSLLGLSNCYMSLNNFSNAKNHLTKTINYLDSESNMLEIAYGDYYDTLGRYYFLKQEYQKAIESYEKCFEIYGEVRSKGRKTNYILSNYFLNGNNEDVLKSLELEAKSGNSQEFFYNRMNYGVKFQSYKDDEALNILIGSIEVLINSNNEYFHLLSDTERETAYDGFREKFEFLNTHLLLNSSDSFLNQFINFRLYYKSLLFKNSSNKFNNSGDIEYLNELKSNTTLINKYYESETNYSAEIDILLSRNRELEKFLAQNRISTSTPNLEDLRNQLGEKEAYIEIVRINKQSRKPIENDNYYQFTDSIYYGAIIIKKNIAPKFVIIDDKNQLEDRYLKYYQNHITGSNKLLKDPKSYSLFFEPIDKELDGIEKIYLSTDGVYNSINVESFFNSGKDKYVIDYIDVKQVLSAQSILNTSKNHSNNSELRATIIGNPAFELNIVSNQNNNEILLRDLSLDYFRENSNSQTISYLPGTEKEINSISDILKQKQWDVQLYSDENATEENLKSINSPTILHIATHGYFLDAPKIDNSKASLLGVQTNHMQSNVYLRSGLLFSGAQNTVNGDIMIEQDNGVFTAQEAKNLNLNDSELVVLSACETGLGENQSGEGVYGLQRAFMIAGAKSIIMSLWSVNDETTQKLMIEFYSNWIEKKIPLNEAFKSAKLNLKKEHPEPFYWAPFVLIE